MGQAEDFRCPNCGAPLAIESDRPTIRCPFCSTQVIVPPELRPRPPEPVQGVTPVPHPYPPAAEPVRRKKAASPVGWLLIFAAILALGILGQALGGTTSGSSSAEVVPTPTATVEPIQRELSASLPRTLRYAGFTIQVTRGVIDNQVKDGENVSYAAGRAFARLDVTLTNTTKENLFLDAQLFKLKLGNGKSYTLDGSTILNSSFIAPDPGSTRDTSLVFEVPVDAQWEGGELIVSSVDKEPAVMPLSGDAPSEQDLLQIPVPKEGSATAQDFTYELLGASIGLDSGSHRADKGTRFLTLGLRMTNTNGQYGANLSSDTYRLLVGGVSVAPLSAPIELVEYKSSVDRQVVFVIPAQAAQATLRVGDVRSPTNEVGSIPLDLSSQAAPPSAP